MFSYFASIYFEIGSSTFTHYGATITPHHDELPLVTACCRTSTFGKEYRFIGKLYLIPKPLSDIQKKIRIKCKIFDLILDIDTEVIRVEYGKLFTDDTEVEFKELYNFISFLNDSFNSKEAFFKIINHEGKDIFEFHMGTPVSIFPNNFNLINSTINSMYRKFCDINIENNTISTGYIINNIRKMNLFGMFGEEYNPDVSGVNAVVISYTIFFKEITLVTFVAFYGSIEISGENILRCRFEKSEILDNFILNYTDDSEGLIKDKLEYFKSILVSKGYKVLP